MRVDPKDAVILLGHGSRDRAAIDEFDRFILFFKERRGFKKVYPGYLELADPLIPAAIDQAIVDGAKRIFAYPLFIFPGRHVLEDLPRILSEAQAKYPEAAIFFGDALNLNPKLLELAKVRIDPAQDRSDPKKTALLVIGRGTLEPKAIAATEAFTNQIKPILPYTDAVHCFAEVVPPYIPDGFEQCIARGAAAIVAFPCLLFTGVIMRRIEKKIALMREKHPSISIRLTDYLGIHPLLAEIVSEGIEASRPIERGRG